VETIVRQDNQTERQPAFDLAPLEGIGAERPKRFPGWRVWLAAGLVLAGAAAAGWVWFSAPAAPVWAEAAVRRGDLANRIYATGKLQAVTTVQVGTQVSGTVSELHADFNDRVRAGQVIARLDPSQLEAQLQQAMASLAAAEASVETARSNSESQQASVLASKANLERATSVFEEAERTYAHTVALIEAGALPARQREIAQAAREQAAAQKAQAEAQYNQSLAQAQASRSQLVQAQAQATQSKAAVEVMKVNLDRTIIRAPIDGVVVSRDVDVGQTVAASLQAPTLFLIAQDLTKMQVLADIDEADVGQLRPESKVSFTVDAFPAETFEGQILQIRLAPNTMQNVVTYTAVISVENPRLQLRPGMTATVTATVAEKRDVLVVPNAALRFQPEGGQNLAAVTPAARRGAAGAARGGVLYKVAGTELVPVPVRLGMTDGAFTEVTGDELAEGERVAIPAQAQAASQQPAQRSPFAAPAAGRRGRI
jgi:HlyD family secretion protein